MMFITLLPIIPLNYKVTSRNIYLPSIGFSVLAAYLFSLMIWNRSGRLWLKRVGLILAVLYFTVSIISIDLASREYYMTQKRVDSIVDDIENSGVDISNCEYVLLDNLPGRVIIGPALIYRLNYWEHVIASNDPVYGPFDIPEFAEELLKEGRNIEIFGYRDGRMVYVKDEYVKRYSIEHNNLGN
jgi:hypothetical protein